MKKFILPFILILLLSSCNAASEKLFDYQNAGGTYEAEISYLGENFAATVTLSPMSDGGRESTEICYLEPESIKGYTVKHNGDGYFAVISGLEIPVTSGSLPQLAYTEALFSLKAEDITSIETDEEGNSVVKAACGSYGAEATVIFASDGSLSSLFLPDAEFFIRIK